MPMFSSEAGVDRVSAPYERGGSAFDAVSGWTEPPQRYTLEESLFEDAFRAKGMWRVSNAMRIPVVDQYNPAAGATWIEARLFSDGYLRGNIKARSGEIQSIVVDVSSRLSE